MSVIDMFHNMSMTDVNLNKLFFFKYLITNKSRTLLLVVYSHVILIKLLHYIQNRFYLS